VVSRPLVVVNVHGGVETDTGPVRIGYFKTALGALTTRGGEKPPAVVKTLAGENRLERDRRMSESTFFMSESTFCRTAGAFAALQT
jgi:hypothetical protein